MLHYGHHFNRLRQLIHNFRISNMNQSKKKMKSIPVLKSYLNFTTIKQRKYNLVMNRSKKKNSISSWLTHPELRERVDGNQHCLHKYRHDHATQVFKNIVGMESFTPFQRHPTRQDVTCTYVKILQTSNTIWFYVTAFQRSLTHSRIKTVVLSTRYLG